EIDREARRRRITERLKSRLDAGMVDEIRGLIDSGVASDSLKYYGLEYKFVTQYVTGELTYSEMFSGLEIAIHQFAKRQMTWLRGMEKRGFKMHWIDYSIPDDEKCRMVLDLIES
ncbi:MAG: tRNA (adenosine(37)-N6)-dimethylallyltransferase MiaA, partial [Paludibacteraceae bacterium]|nr:tRNA (adenosine(37)-N6)-dimethylallyltransferase MiaA [Paludibacteraceae bacterium]